MGNSQAEGNSMIGNDSTIHAFNGQFGKKTLTSFEVDTTNEISENVTVIPTSIDQKT